MICEFVFPCVLPHVCAHPQATLRVTNVSTEATRDDMHELFRRFGPIARVSVPQVQIYNNTLY